MLGICGSALTVPVTHSYAEAIKPRAVSARDSTALSVALTGADRLTDRSPGDLVAIITNTSDTAMTTELHAIVGDRYRIRITDPEINKDNTVIDVASHSSTVIFMKVEVKSPLRREKAAVVVFARGHPIGNPPKQIKNWTANAVATRELSVEWGGGDLFSIPTGGSGTALALVLPGLLAVASWLKVWDRDRTRMGLPSQQPQVTMWENKWLLVVSVALSFAAAWSYKLLFGVDLLDTVTLLDLCKVIAGSFVAALTLAWLVNLLYRWRKPRIPDLSLNGIPERKAILRAANQNDSNVKREVYVVGDRRGIFVHRDRGAHVLTPPIGFSVPTTLKEANETAGFDLAKALNAIENAAGGQTFDGHYAQEPAWLDTPTGDMKWITSPVAVVAPPRDQAQGPTKMIGFDEEA